MFRRLWATSLLGLLAGYAPQALANNFNYNYFEFRSATSPSSIGAEFSTYILQNLHAIGHFDKQFNDAFDFAGGAGFNGPFGEFMDLNGAMLVHFAQGKKNNNQYNDREGFMLELNIGARVWLTENLEVHGKLGNIDEGSVVEAGARFHSTEQLSVGASLRNNGIWGSQAAIDVRFQF